MKYPYAQGCDLSRTYSNEIAHDRSQYWAYGGDEGAVLDGALALVEGDVVPVFVAKDLDLDMAPCTAHHTQSSLG